MDATEQITAQYVPIGGDREISDRIEAYLAKRDGVDKLLKISRYASKIIIASSLFESQPLNSKLKSFESSVGVTRKALRLGKFLQSFNALKKSSELKSKRDFMASVASGGEGLYYFVEQFVWLSKAGLIDGKHSSRFSKIGAWCEFVGYVGSISVKWMDLSEIGEEKERLRSVSDENVRVSNMKELEELEEKEMMKRLSIVQDWADWLMAFADVRDGKGPLTSPLLLSSAGLLSALISAHKIWVSCKA
ncbi:hypothetical protein Syun_015719 [Stephania yunnanensis]|uniref:Peroxisomal biogenesis factor 11 n=1 Tax=Stephania yunnanensis TaxID=152371 RepID=A0AAP0PAT7_9MAGN